MRKTNGITLIALVITIIVLLILAGVSIAMVTGDNGILTQAAKAKEETERVSVIEQAQTDIMGKQAEEGTANLDRTELKGILDMYFEGVPYDFSLEAVLQTKETYGNYQILLSEIYGGTIEEKLLTATDMTEEQKKELYGSYVTNYECANNDAIETEEGIPGKWMIFHIDDDNIYLIASDYINTVPNGKDGGKPDMGLNSSYPRGVSLLNIFDDYVNGSADISRIGQQLNKSYFKENNYTSTDYNMKSVAYMLDTNIWNTFKEEGVAEYAIGGPTIELFFESYNKVYPDVNYPEGKFKARGKNSRGYEISTDGGKTWGDYVRTGRRKLFRNR